MNDCFGICERHAVLGPARAGERRPDVVEVEVDDLRVLGMLARLVPEEVLAAVRLHELDLRLGAAGQAEIVERQLVDREEAAGRAVLGGHVPEGRPVGDRERPDALAEVLDELSDDARPPQQLGHGQHEVSRGRALAQPPGQPEPDHLRHEHRHRLAEHGRLRLDAADAPAEDAEPVHHRGVGVEPDQRVGEGHAVAHLHHPSEQLEVHLMADARARRHQLEVAQRALAPPQERVALAVPLHLVLDVDGERHPGGERVDLHRMVDHELGRDQRIHLRRVAPERGGGVADRGQVDDRRHARQVLHQHPRGEERDLLRRPSGRSPCGQSPRSRFVTGAQDVLEQDPQGVGQPPRLERGDRVEAGRLPAGARGSPPRQSTS